MKNNLTRAEWIALAQLLDKNIMSGQVVSHDELLAIQKVKKIAKELNQGYNGGVSQ